MGPLPPRATFFFSELNYFFEERCSILVFAPAGSRASNFFSRVFLMRLARRTKRKKDYSKFSVRDKLSNFFSDRAISQTVETMSGFENASGYAHVVKF